jgi:hypothetical protein
MANKQRRQITQAGLSDDGLAVDGYGAMVVSLLQPTPDELRTVRYGPQELGEKPFSTVSSGQSSASVEPTASVDKTVMMLRRWPGGSNRPHERRE